LERLNSLRAPSDCHPQTAKNPVAAVTGTAHNIDSAKSNLNIATHPIQRAPKMANMPALLAKIIFRLALKGSG
jgi:hypothetical protein